MALMEALRNYGSNYLDENDPQGQSLWSILAGRGQGARRAEQETDRNIYSQGYLGEDISGGIREPRGVFGSLLQDMHVLGEPTPRQATPYERYLYEQGKTGHAKESLGLSAEEFNLQNAKRSRQISDFSTLLNAEKLGAGAPPSVFGGLPEDELTSGEAVGSIADTKRAEDAAHRKLTERYMEALIESAGKKGTGKQVNVFDQLKKVYGLNKSLVDLINTKTLGGGKDMANQGLPYAALNDITDPKEKQRRVDELRLLRKQLEARLASQGIPMDSVGSLADALSGSQENEYETVLGLKAGGGGNPNQARMLEDRIGKPSLGQRALDMILKGPSAAFNE